MKPGKSLEDVFLETRKNTNDNSFPMISTPEGLSINKDIYPNITPYLYDYNKEAYLDKMSDYLLSTASNEAYCARQFQYDSLQKQLENLKAISALNMSAYAPQINRIKNLIKNYKAKQDDYINFLRAMGAGELKRKETFTGSFMLKNKEIKDEGNYTWKEIIEADFDSQIKTNAEYRDISKDSAAKARFAASVDMYTKARKKQQEILTRYPKIKSYQTLFKEQISAINGTTELSNEIALEERDLYDNLYKNARDSNKSENSACKDFIL
jgi:hypothetical protein